MPYTMRETIDTYDGPLIQVWHVIPPPPGSSFKVIEETWTDDERHIHAWQFTEED